MDDGSLEILKAESCGGHLGGELGNRLFNRLMELKWLEANGGKGDYRITEEGRAGFEKLGVFVCKRDKKPEEQLPVKTCIACGMPMTEPSDYARGDVNLDYCKYCARPDGNMQSYEEKLENTVEFIVRTQGLDKEAARATAVLILSRLPAWKK